jgi:hypothetical protein
MIRLWQHRKRTGERLFSQQGGRGVKRRQGRGHGLPVEPLKPRTVPGLIAPLTFATGFDPSAVAVADFNGDGIPDLAVANRNNDSASVLLGNGDGSFRDPVTYGAGSFLTAVAALDVNSDGLPDLVVGNANITVLLNDRQWPTVPGHSQVRSSPPQATALSKAVDVRKPLVWIPNLPQPLERSSDNPMPVRATATPSPAVDLMDQTFDTAMAPDDRRIVLPPAPLRPRHPTKGWMTTLGTGDLGDSEQTVVGQFGPPARCSRSLAFQQGVYA